MLDAKFGKYRYWVEGSYWRHIGIHRYIPLFSFFMPTVANVYAKGESGYGVVTVYSRKLYGVMKEWAKKNKYSNFEVGFVSKGDLND